MQYEKCDNCHGYGVINDYGPLALDFFGPKECPVCKGSGKVRSRDRNGRFKKIEPSSLALISEKRIRSVYDIKIERNGQ